jgi:tetratricopeptide (TPR) repeat protein
MHFRIFAAGLVVLGALSAPARADELSEVTRLHHAGQTSAALERADRTLATHPKDAQMRFLKSVILADIGRTPEALTLLQQIVQDYPELAEPHNNLAAIYAASGEYGKSRAELEETIRLNPGYAPAHENMGDVLALLATQSYAKALRLEPASTTLPRKIELIRLLVATGPGERPPATIAPAASAPTRRR